MSTWLWVGAALLGGLGALARFMLDAAISERARGELPWGTLIVNVSGALLLGLLAGTTLSREVTALLGSAALGSYTTFSTWMLESRHLGEDGQMRLLAVNLVLPLALGLAAVALGRWLVGAL